MMLIESKRFLTNDTNLFKIQGPKINAKSTIIQGPMRVEIRVVSHGD